MRYSVTKVFRLDFGHRIANFNLEEARGHELYKPDCGLLANKCANIHGHSVEIHVTIESNELDEQQFVMNTGLIKVGLSEELDKLDHALALDKHDPLFPELERVMKKENLRLFVMDCPPSFEALSRHFYGKMKIIIAKLSEAEKLKVTSVKMKGPSIEVTYCEK